VRLIFVSDQIPSELRRVIEFLNERMSPTEVLGIEIKQYVGDGDLKTLVPRMVGQTEQARIQKVGGASVDVDWDYYRQRVQPERLAIVEKIYEQMETAIKARDLPWQPKLKSAYLGFYRPGLFYCCGITVKREQPPEFWVKLPLQPEELRASGKDVPDLYPELPRRWDANNKQWTWEVPTVEAVPNIGPAIELTSRHQPARGPMQAPPR
jgi:hypothetical protein